MGSGGNDHWYELKTAALTWTSARTTAETLLHLGLPGHLATIADGAENAFVTSVLAGISAHIGFNDLAVDGVYEWVTSESVTFTNWNECGYFCLMYICVV